jgi:5-methylcytosine-specific restriction enzyme A
MTVRRLRICAAPGCHATSPDRYCPAHAARAKPFASVPPRASAHARGYDARWRKARLAYLAAHPLCVACAKDGRTTAATVVDHIVPHRGDAALFWDAASNWAALCASHHAQKTARGA